MAQWCKSKRLQTPKIDETDRGGVYSFGSYCFVYVAPKEKHWMIVDTIVHESVHVFQKTMTYVVENKAGEEVAAYTTAAIATQLMKDFHALHEERQTGLQDWIRKVS